MSKLSMPLLFLVLSVNTFAQGDKAERAVRWLAKGKTGAAISFVTRDSQKLDDRVGACERYFVLAMAACQKNDIGAAFKHAQHAVELGLPTERLQAGPRDILAPLYAHSEFKAWMQKQEKQLIHGPLLGSVTDSSASFWVRTAEESDVQIKVNPVPDNTSNTQQFTGKARTSGKSDYTTTITISGLGPDTQYKYKVLVNGRQTETSAEFRTFPKQGKSFRFSIAFGGGAGFTAKHERMWTTIEKHNVSALFMLGDNVYIDDPTHPMTQRYCYYRRQSQPEWRHLTASTSTFSIYDDHDFGIDNCIPGPEIEQPVWKRKVWEVFKENWINPAYGGGEKQPGCWFDFYIGDVHFIMLDGRYYRDLQGGSMLGPVQKAWLFETLKSSKGKFLILASPVPWSPGVKQGRDTWDGFRKEREEIFSFIEKHRIDGVILMAADRHRSDLRRIKRSKGYNLYEVMSSRLTNIHTHKLMKDARGSEFIMGYNTKCSFGLLDFDTTAEDPEVKYTIINIDNEVIDSLTLK
ncbi:alkaline phosphatase D family protein, partial [Verrucomicrobiota bacterium]